jgi:hypothetical protein
LRFSELQKCLLVFGVPFSGLLCFAKGDRCFFDVGHVLSMSFCESFWSMWTMKQLAVIDDFLPSMTIEIWYELAGGTVLSSTAHEIKPEVLGACLPRVGYVRNVYYSRVRL